MGRLKVNMPCPTAQAYKRSLVEHQALNLKVRFKSGFPIRLCDLHGTIRMWGSLESRLPWEQKIAGSNPVILTNPIAFQLKEWQRMIQETASSPLITLNVRYANG